MYFSSSKTVSVINSPKVWEGKNEGGTLQQTGTRQSGRQLTVKINGRKRCEGGQWGARHGDCSMLPFARLMRKHMIEVEGCAGHETAVLDNKRR